MDSVLVIYVYTKDQEYCRFLYPKIFNSLSYKLKSAAYIDQTKLSGSGGLVSGELAAAAGRQAGIKLARELQPDWLLFMDLNLEPEPDCIQKLLAVKHALVGGLQASGGDSWHIVGHNYKDDKKTKKLWLKPSDVDKNQTIDCISGACLLIARGIYERIDLEGYVGLDTVPGRNTTWNEYFIDKICNSLKIRPHACYKSRPWYYHTNGRAYKLFGEQKIWKV